MTRIASTWTLRTRSLELGRRTLVMGVVNVTPDSFSDGGRYLQADAAVRRCIECLDEGADILDLGAESTRPGVGAGGDTGLRTGDESQVSAEQEQARLIPVIDAILQIRPRAVLSVDTYKAATARAALAAGAEIVNDVSGLNWDPEMAKVCAEAGCGAVLMHARGRPREWKSLPSLGSEELMRIVTAGLKSSLAAAAAAGIHRRSIVLDPGYGFGKRGVENFTLLSRQARLLELGLPLLAGVSSKSFLGHALAPLYGGAAAPVHARHIASVAAMVAAILAGASIVRVHRVREAVEAALVADAVLQAGI